MRIGLISDTHGNLARDLWAKREWPRRCAWAIDLFFVCQGQLALLAAAQLGTQSQQA